MLNIPKVTGSVMSEINYDNLSTSRRNRGRPFKRMKKGVR